MAKFIDFFENNNVLTLPLFKWDERPPPPSAGLRSERAGSL